MAGLGERFTAWVEERRLAWGDTLGGWLKSWLELAAEAFFDVIAQKGSEQLAPLIARLEATGAVPPEIQPLINELKNPTGELAGLNVAGLAGRVTGGAVSKILDAILLDIAYNVNYNTMRLRASEEDNIKLYIAHVKSLGQLQEDMRVHGYHPDLTAQLATLWKLRLPTDIVLPAYLRDKAKYPIDYDSLNKLGLTQEQIELLLEMSYKIPGVQDIIRYVVKETYNPEIYQAFGQDQEYPSIAEADAEKAGVRPDMLRKEWISHWNLPGVAQGYDMLHRGLITPDRLQLLLKALDVMPGWRAPLTELSWSIPGRIELRMMARYGLVDKPFLVEALKKDGLAEEYRDVVADMNLVLGIRTDLQTRYSKGWITAAEVLAELEASGLGEGIRTRVYQYIIKNESANRTTAQKNLTLAQIEKGVRKGKLTRAQAVDLLIDLGYDAAEALFLLSIDVPVDETDAAVKDRELTKADILAGLKAGTMLLPHARLRLLELRYQPNDADFILQTYLAQVKPPTEPAQREASKADIVAAVKLGLITPEQGYTMLTAIGYSSDAANFILLVKADVSPFSPATFDEFKGLTHGWRQSQGLNIDDMAKEVQAMRLDAAQAIVEGKMPIIEQQRLQIDTIRRRRRAGMITREQEIAQLTALKVPPDYVQAVVANDDTRLAVKQQQRAG